MIKMYLLTRLITVLHDVD